MIYLPFKGINVLNFLIKSFLISILNIKVRITENGIRCRNYKYKLPKNKAFI